MLPEMSVQRTASPIELRVTTARSFFDVQRILNSLAFDRVAQSAWQRIAIDVTRQEIILRTAPYSLFRQGSLPLPRQNRDVGRCAE